MSNTFFLKQGDTFPNMTTQLSDEYGVNVNLSGATVTCKVSLSLETTPIIERAATIVMPQTGDNLGKCYLEFVNGDTNKVGKYLVEWRVVFPDGKIATFPRGASTKEKLYNYLIVQDAI